MTGFTFSARSLVLTTPHPRNLCIYKNPPVKHDLLSRYLEREASPSHSAFAFYFMSFNLSKYNVK